jgi:hypothetical protein
VSQGIEHAHEPHALIGGDRSAEVADSPELLGSDAKPARTFELDGFDALLENLP